MLEIYPCHPEDIPTLEKCAATDGHGVIAPAFIMEKNNYIVGYLGIVPAVTVWLDREKTQIRDSIAAMQFWENHLRSGGVKVIGVPCTNDSPLKSYLPKVGYIDSQANLFLKNIERRTR